MKPEIKYGRGRTEYGPGIEIVLTGEMVALAIHSYLVAHGIHISGPSTVTVNDDLCEYGEVYVDPSGFVVTNGQKFSGRGLGR